MITIHGTYTTAIIYTDELESSAEGQIRALCEQPFAAGSKNRIMADIHTGKGCTIECSAVFRSANTTWSTARSE